MDLVVEDLLSCLDDPALALLQWNEAFGVVQVGASPRKADSDVDSYFCEFHMPFVFLSVSSCKCILTHLVPVLACCCKETFMVIVMVENPMSASWHQKGKRQIK